MIKDQYEKIPNVDKSLAKITEQFNSTHGRDSQDGERDNFVLQDIRLLRELTIEPAKKLETLKKIKRSSLYGMFSSFITDGKPYGITASPTKEYLQTLKSCIDSNVQAKDIVELLIEPDSSTSKTATIPLYEASDVLECIKFIQQLSVQYELSSATITSLLNVITASYTQVIPGIMFNSFRLGNLIQLSIFNKDLQAFPTVMMVLNNIVQSPHVQEQQLLDILNMLMNYCGKVTNPAYNKSKNAEMNAVINSTYTLATNEAGCAVMVIDLIKTILPKIDVPTIENSFVILFMNNLFQSMPLLKDSTGKSMLSKFDHACELLKLFKNNNFLSADECVQILTTPDCLKFMANNRILLDKINAHFPELHAPVAAGIQALPSPEQPAGSWFRRLSPTLSPRNDTPENQRLLLTPSSLQKYSSIQ